MSAQLPIEQHIYFSILNRPKKNSNSTQLIQGHTANPGNSEQTRPLQLGLSPSGCRSHGRPGNNSQRLFQKTIKGFDWKINGQALCTALYLAQLGKDRHASTNLNLYNMLVRLQRSSLSPSLSPCSQCRSSGNHSQSTAVVRSGYD